MTPAEIVYMVDGYNERKKDGFEQIKWAIHQAGVLNSYAFHNPKKYPDFKRFMFGNKKERQTPEQMLQMVKMLNSAFGGVDKTKSPGT